jgi:hypothetical protein
VGDVHPYAYMKQGTLYAVRLDLSTLTVHGAPIPLLDDVAYSPLFGYAPAKDLQTANHVTLMLNFDEEVRRRATSR